VQDFSLRLILSRTLRPVTTFLLINCYMLNFRVAHARLYFAFIADPLGLAAEPSNLKRYQESEVIHCRWAMLGVAGCLAVELLGQGDWVSAQAKLTTGKETFMGAEVPFDLGTVVALNFIAMAGAESFRNNADAEKRIYPGGAFDPMGMSKGNLEELKLKEIKNGRLAMVAFLGFVAQWKATGASPLQALSAHLADPFGANFALNGVSLPDSVF
jgi:light-harvesting complex I chlorophyll a/b binding protein 1